MKVPGIVTRALIKCGGRRTVMSLGVLAVAPRLSVTVSLLAKLKSTLHLPANSDDNLRDDYGYVARNPGFDRVATSRGVVAGESGAH